MIDYKTLMERCISEEQELQFTHFNNEDALSLGLFLVEKCKKVGHSLTIDITKSGQQIFHYSFDGTCPDNDFWVQRKINLVTRMHHSSFYLSCYLADLGQTIEERFNIDSFEFAAHGGCFPLIIKNVGCVGTITVSGLPQAEDHAFVVAGIRDFLQK